MIDPPLKRAEVAWMDAHVSTSTTNIKRAAKTKPILTYSIGYVISENAHGIVLVSDCYPDHKKEGRVPGFIPWEMIEEWHYLED